MKRLILLLMITVLASTVLADTKTILETPTLIRGNPKVNTYFQRDYSGMCHWEAGTGPVCVRDGKIEPVVSRRERRESFLKTKVDTDATQSLRKTQGKVKVTKAADSKASESGYISGKLGQSFAFRGRDTTRLRDLY